MEGKIIPFREVPLTQGKVALVDEQDYPLVSQFKSRKTGKSLWMHRLILNCPPSKQGEHRDGNGLNNRRSNLRPATNAQNTRNMAVRPASRSGYKGVSLHSSHGINTGEWRASIHHQGRNIYIGKFSDPKDAAIAYDAKAKELWGEFAWLNFPEGESR